MMATPFFTALLKNLPTIISVGHGLYNLFTQTMASKNENDRVLQAFQLLRTHQDDLDRFLEDPERQRILMEGYTILMRWIQENNRGGDGGAAYRQLPLGLDNLGDNVPRYGPQRIGFREMNNGYRGKDDFHDVFRSHRDYDRINDNRGRDGFRGMDDFPSRDDFHGRNDYRGRNDFGGRNGFGDDRRKGGDRSDDYVYRGRNDGRDGLIGDYRPRGDDRDNRTKRVENDGRQQQARDDNLNKKSSKGASSSKGALNKMKEQLVCDVCRGNYDLSQHRPTLMPTCGHTFCRACLREESRNRHLFCPVCRSDPFMDVNSLPTNQPLLQLVMEQEGDGSDESSSSSCSPDNTASCNNTRSSCSEDTPSCGKTQNSCTDDSSCSERCGGDSLAMLPFEEQIQLVLMLSREEMGRIEDDGHNPFAFLDELEANQGTGLTQAIRRIESNNNSLHDSGRTGGTCIKDEDEDIRRAIELSLQIDTAEGHIGGTERCTVAQDDISRREVMQTREVLAQASAPVLSEIQPNHHFGWDHESRREREEKVNESEALRKREREEMEREREELRRKQEAFKKEQEEWMRSREQERNRERARNTLAALGCYGEDHEQMNSNRYRDDDDDCKRPQTKKTNSSSGKNNGGMYRDADCDEDDDDNCCPDEVCRDKKNDCFKNSCSDDDDVWCDTKDDCFKNCISDDDECSNEMCGAAATEPYDLNQTNDNKQDRSEINLKNITFMSEEELEKARMKQDKWDRRMRRNEEELQMALALSRSMHEVEMAQAPQAEDP